MHPWLTILAAVGFALAAGPLLLFIWNWRLYRRPEDALSAPAVSVLIPARDEARAIREAVESALGSGRANLEVIVLDDHSQDETAEIVRQITQRDGRVRLATAPPLPAGWCGKQHACHVLAKQARHEVLLFMDADVRLAPDAVRRMAAFMQASGADLISGIPRQELGSFLERLLLPLMHFVLLAYLPMARMRRSLHPAYGAGCGQLFMTRRPAYEQCGGHAAIRASRHDGVTLPRAYRSAGMRTDLFDATGIASCRMYRSAGEVWRGLSKNATEGMASPAGIVPWTILLLGGQVMPLAMAIGLLAGADRDSAAWWPAMVLSAAAAGAGYAIRAATAWRFGQPVLSALLHPVGIVVLLVIQWVALARQAAGRPATWKGRSYDAEPPAAVAEA